MKNKAATPSAATAKNAHLGEPGRQAHARPRRHRLDGPRHAAGGRAFPDFAVGHAAPGGQGRKSVEPRADAQGRVLFHDGQRVDHRVTPQPHRAEHQFAPLDPRVLDVNGSAHAGARVDLHQIGRLQAHRVDKDVRPDLRPHRPQIPVQERRSGNQIDRREFAEPVGQPPAEIGHAPERIPPGLQPSGQQPFAGDRYAEGGHFRRHERQDREQHGQRECCRLRRR